MPSGFGELVVATSRYQAADLIRRSGRAPVGITVGRPKFRLGCELAGTVRMLAPVGLLQVDDEAEFTRLYRERLDRVGVQKIAARLEELAAAAGAQGVVLLCFESAGEFCHRRVFAGWWRAQTGTSVSELA
ncbi:MAG: DUF488 family protein [Gaiellaceae bacterium]